MSVFPNKALQIKIRCRPVRSGFTLVELLVALAVLGLMLGLVAQITAAVGRVWTDTRNRADNFTRARAALDLVTRDLQDGVFRSDLPAPLSQPLTFYTRRPGMGGGSTSRQLSLVRYETVFLNNAETNKDEVFLRRSDREVDWDAEAGLFAPGAPATPLPVPAGAQDVFPGVLRMAVYFRDEQGNLQTSQSVASPRSVVAYVGLVVVDQDGQKLLTQTQWSQLQQKFQEAGLQLSTWRTAMEDPAFFDGYPPRLRSGIRIFERAIALP